MFILNREIMCSILDISGSVFKYTQANIVILINFLLVATPTHSNNKHKPSSEITLNIKLKQI